jgi:alpha-tubulin suppressor-like RCC1 family protein
MLLDLPARDIATSMLHTLILLQDGSVFICGRSGHNIPVKISLPLLAVSIACNADTGFALLEDDSIYGWGNNTLGQLGVGDTIDRLVPTKMILPPNMRPISIKGGYAHTLVLMENGSVYGCGETNEGQLGVKASANKLLLVKMNLPQRVVSISPGSESSYCITDTGDVYGFGFNTRGQAGLPPRYDNLGMVAVKILLPSPVSMVEAGHDEVVFVLENGEVYGCSNLWVGIPPMKMELVEEVGYYFA